MYSRITFVLGLSCFLSTLLVLLWQAQRTNLIDIKGLRDKWKIPEKPTNVDFMHNATIRDALDSRILNVTLGFGKILTISLPVRTDHRDRMTVAGDLTDIHFEYLDGVLGKDVHKSNLPTAKKVKDKDLGAFGAWRAHVNAIETVVAQNLSSALITEDDLDWDIRIKSQLQDVAAGTRALMQPLRIERRDAAVRDIIPVPLTIPPRISPYGDDWDLIWLGHCRMQPPLQGEGWIPNQRYIIPDDPTVPSWKHYKPHEPRIKEQYPEHTRIISHAKMGLCSLAYAVSQRGARKLLHEMTERKFEAAFDVMMFEWCERGFDNTCMTALPQVFNHYRPPGPVSQDSDLRVPIDTDEIRLKGVSVNIRLSTMLNVEALLEGRTDFEDQYPD